MMFMFLKSKSKMRALMLLAILMITGFQVMWLFESYQRENRLLRNELSALFRETAFAILMPDFQFTDSLHTNHFMSPNSGRQHMMIIMKKDSLKLTDSAMKDSLRLNQETFSRHEEIGKMLSGDSISPAQLLGDFAVRMKEEGYNFEVRVHKARAFIRKDKVSSDTIFTHAVPLRFSGEASIPPLNGMYNASVTGFHTYLLKRLWPQFALSFLLIFVTVLAFYVLWKSMNTQQRLLREKDQLVSNITHELKTPVATVSVALEALQRFDSGSDPVRTKEYLDISRQQLQRLNLLIDKVLRLSMFEGGKIELQCETVSLHEIAAEVVNPLQLQFESAGGKLLWESTAPALQVWADKQHLTSLLFNLIDNALKYGGTPPEAVLSIFTEGNFAVIEVCDNGTGIDPQYRKKIFEPFFRIPGKGQRHNVKGHGLGLSYVAEIVRLHQGTVEVKDAGKGAVFTVKLPLHHG
ncbi:MAG: HAMP domain-containing histidine kinase [Bacteroidia bacterium]|jgi:two-component system phosphate regulon sensor histidine kinase PhoR|nr:HAMP domain-containing histidine kinase [Bacteroidia bacterium]